MELTEKLVSPGIYGFTPFVLWDRDDVIAHSDLIEEHKTPLRITFNLLEIQFCGVSSARRRFDSKTQEGQLVTPTSRWSERDTCICMGI